MIAVFAAALRISLYKKTSSFMYDKEYFRKEEYTELIY